MIIMIIILLILINIHSSSKILWSAIAASYIFSFRIITTIIKIIIA